MAFLFIAYCYIVKFKEVICTWKSINQEHISNFDYKIVCFTGVISL